MAPLKPASGGHTRIQSEGEQRRQDIGAHLFTCFQRVELSLRRSRRAFAPSDPDRALIFFSFLKRGPFIFIFELEISSPPRICGLSGVGNLSIATMMMGFCTRVLIGGSRWGVRTELDGACKERNRFY